MKKNVVKLLVTLMVTILMAGVYGCKKKEGPLERAGKELDRAAEKTGEKLEKAGDKIKESVK
ncbi:MAG: hypothetical protein RW306_02625 [Geobacteraceae bacterium]|nr:hypothetical protein [Geobacteraceae bacterium]